MIRAERVRAAAAAGGLALGASAGVAHAGGACKLAQVGELAVKFEHNQPLVAAKVDGHDAWFLIDTGSAATLMFEQGARRLGLKTVAVDHVHFYGVGGEARVGETTVGDLKLGGYAAKNVSLMVASTARGDSGGDVVGVLGRDVLGRMDVEFDLPHKIVRLFSPIECRGAFLAYWSRDALVQPIEWSGAEPPPVMLTVVLNGHRTPAMLDSGAATTVVTSAIAASAGVKPQLWKRSGQASGIGGATLDEYTATFPKVQLAEETVSNARLRIADIDRYAVVTRLGSRLPTKLDGLAPMLLGADFLRAHRVLISNSQRQLYFSYLGGTIFEVGPPVRVADADGDKGATTAPAAAPAKP